MAASPTVPGLRAKRGFTHATAANRRSQRTQARRAAGARSSPPLVAREVGDGRIHAAQEAIQADGAEQAVEDRNALSAAHS